MATTNTVTARLAALRATIDQIDRDVWHTPPMSYGPSTPGSTHVVVPHTDKELFRVIRAMGLAVGKRDGEYRITRTTGTPAEREAAAYYTNDKQDALITARCIAIDDAHRREADRTGACLRAIVEDMDAEQLAAFKPLTFIVPHVDVVGMVAAEKARRASRRAFAERAIAADAKQFGAPLPVHVLNVVLVARDGLTMSAQVTTKVDPVGGLDASGWDVAAEWVLNWRRMVPPVFAVVASQDGTWFARYDVDRDGTLSPAPATR